MNYSVIGFEDVVKMRLASSSLKCISTTGRLLLIHSKDVVQILQSDFILKTEIEKQIDK